MKKKKNPNQIWTTYSPLTRIIGIENLSYTKKRANFHLILCLSPLVSFSSFFVFLLSLSLLPSILRRRFDTKCWVHVSASARYPAWAPPQRITRMSPPPPAPFRAPSPSTSRRSTSHRSGPAAASAAADLSSFPAIPLAADPARTTLTTTTTKNMQNDMRKGGTARTDETRSLCLFSKVGFTKQKRKEIYRL